MADGSEPTTDEFVNSPAHVIVGSLACRVSRFPERTWPVVLGSLLPDLPMYLFYAVERATGSSEREIWTSRYFADNWQLFFDWFNSAPLILALLLVALLCRSHWWLCLLTGMLLHVLCDFPLHHDDGHRHLLPLTDWQYRSPVSYWDPNHYGLIVAPLELLMTIAGAVYLAWPGQPRSARIVGSVILSLYLLAIVIALVVWLRSRM